MLIESVTFRLNPGTDEADFLAADARLQAEFAYGRPGLVRRTTGRGSDGSWLVLTFWADDAAADAAWAAADTDAAAQSVAALVDAASLTTTRFTTLD